MFPGSRVSPREHGEAGRLIVRMFAFAFAVLVLVARINPVRAMPRFWARWCDPCVLRTAAKKVTRAAASVPSRVRVIADDGTAGLRRGLPVHPIAATETNAMRKTAVLLACAIP